MISGLKVHSGTERSAPNSVAVHGKLSLIGCWIGWSCQLHQKRLFNERKTEEDGEQYPELQNVQTAPNFFPSVIVCFSLKPIYHTGVSVYSDINRRQTGGEECEDCLVRAANIGLK